MKRFFILLAASTVCINFIYSNSSIQRTFLGLTLGQSSKDEVYHTLISKGFEIYSDTTMVAFFTGEVKHEGSDFNALVTFFLEDTLTTLVFTNKCIDNCDSIKRNLKENFKYKYDKLQDARTTDLYDIFLSPLIKYTDTTWSRKDDRTIFTYGDADSVYCCLYLAEDFFIKKIHTSAYYIDNTTHYSDENIVQGVAGVKFGDSKETIRRIIGTKSEGILDSDEHKLGFYNIKVGGSAYTYAEFFFKQGKGLVSVSLQKSFELWKEESARAFYDNIVAQYKNKYTNLVENDDRTYAFCGAMTKEYNTQPPIVIFFKKDLSKGGSMRYYVNVTYFILNAANLYDDEI